MTELSAARWRIAAVVLNYRTPDLVLDGLPPLQANLDPERDLVILVDNASGDNSVARFREAVSRGGWKNVRILESPENGGFGAGLNLGIAEVDADAYCLLNSDTQLLPGAVPTLWAALRSAPEVGIVTPRLQWPDGTPQVSCFRFHTPWSELIAGAATGPVRRLLGRWDIPLPLADHRSSPPWASFAAVLVDSQLVRAIGPLDDAFFMYFEDVDYCRRARTHGWTVLHEPQARVVHLRGRSSPVKSLTAARRRRPRYYYTSRTRYFRKWYGPAGPLLANVAWTLGRAIAWLREIIGQKQPHTVAHELRDNWRG